MLNKHTILKLVELIREGSESGGRGENSDSGMKARIRPDSDLDSHPTFLHLFPVLRWFYYFIFQFSFIRFLLFLFLSFSFPALLFSSFSFYIFSFFTRYLSTGWHWPMVPHPTELYTIFCEILGVRSMVETNEHIYSFLSTFLEKKSYINF